MLEVKNLSYCYKSRNNFTLRQINLDLKAGEMLLIAGRSGCGKSTLIKAITGLLNDNNTGMLLGKIFFDKVDITDYPPDKIGLLAGCVYQSPDDQLFAMTVADEVGFALENQGFDVSYIKKQVTETLKLVGLQGFEDYSIHKLSGGQRQRLALASILVTKPRLLILDEPVSQMNPQGVHKFMQLLSRLNKEEGIAILMIEHRVNELYPYFERIAIMNDGQFIYDGEIKSVWELLTNRQDFGIREPQTIKLCRCLNLSILTTDIDKLVQTIKSECKISYNNKISEKLINNIALVQVKNLAFRYPNSENKTLDNINFSLYKGEIVALMGFNGAGKSTLMNLLGGLLKSCNGIISFSNLRHNNWKHLKYLRQEADLMLVADTVKEELCWNNVELSKEDLQLLLEKLSLENYADDFPLALSKGQRLRVVLGAMLAQNPDILLLDEPTTGQDEQSLSEIKKLLHNYKKNGGSAFICTHDMELAGEIADRVIILANGRILGCDCKNKILSDISLLNAGGLEASILLEVCKKLMIPPCIQVKEVLKYVSKAAMGRG